MAIETNEESQLVETGLYATIRHPLYLGNLFLFVACPLFLAARISWVFMVLGMVGVVAWIQIEEAFLLNNLPAYGEYGDRTGTLIPGVY